MHLGRERDSVSYSDSSLLKLHWFETKRSQDNEWKGNNQLSKAGTTLNIHPHDRQTMFATILPRAVITILQNIMFLTVASTICRPYPSVATGHWIILDSRRIAYRGSRSWLWRANRCHCGAGKCRSTKGRIGCDGKKGAESYFVQFDPSPYKDDVNFSHSRSVSYAL